ncbi:hypothetical protein HDU76_005093 [Blyttiomyces sp. JEL0837]|nr:hypothetical protein HDU76_005093 [Blyttiomyces sp. JEL0837]
MPDPTPPPVPAKELPPVPPVLQTRLDGIQLPTRGSSLGSGVSSPTSPTSTSSSALTSPTAARPPTSVPVPLPISSAGSNQQSISSNISNTTTITSATVTSSTATTRPIASAFQIHQRRPSHQASSGRSTATGSSTGGAGIGSSAPTLLHSGPGGVTTSNSNASVSVPVSISGGSTSSSGGSITGIHYIGSPPTVLQHAVSGSSGVSVSMGGIGSLNGGGGGRASSDLLRSREGTFSSTSMTGSGNVVGMGIVGGSAAGGVGAGGEFMLYGSSSDGTWQTICSRVLPLFNSEGLKGSMEDLNDLVNQWLNEAQAQQVNPLDEVRELLMAGVVTLGNKIVAAGDETLIPRLVELWTFLFGPVIPYLQGVFLPLRTRYRPIVSGQGGRIGNAVKGQGVQVGRTGVISATASAGLAGNDGGDSGVISGPPDVRAMALMIFRDLIVLSMASRLQAIFPRLFIDVRNDRRLQDIAAKLIQMFSVLQSLGGNVMSEPSVKCRGLLAALKETLRIDDADNL